MPPAAATVPRSRNARAIRFNMVSTWSVSVLSMLPKAYNRTSLSSRAVIAITRLQLRAARLSDRMMPGLQLQSLCEVEENVRAAVVIARRLEMGAMRGHERQLIHVTAAHRQNISSGMVFRRRAGMEVETG